MWLGFLMMYCYLKSFLFCLFFQSPKQSTQSFTIIPQSTTHVRISFRSLYPFFVEPVYSSTSLQIVETVYRLFVVPVFRLFVVPVCRFFLVGFCRLFVEPVYSTGTSRKNKKNILRCCLLKCFLSMHCVNKIPYVFWNLVIFLNLYTVIV